MNDLRPDRDSNCGTYRLGGRFTCPTECQYCDYFSRWDTGFIVGFGTLATHGFRGGRSWHALGMTFLLVHVWSSPTWVCYAPKSKNRTIGGQYERRRKITDFKGSSVPMWI